MNTHKILLGALLIKPNLAPYALPDLEIEYFPADLQPVFAALSGFWNATGKLDAVEACARYPEQSTAIVECAQACEAECIRITRETVESWTQLIREQAALTQFQSLALQAGSAQTTFADLPELYSRMGEALTLDREGQDFRPIGELVDDYVRHLDEKPRYIPTGLSVLDKHLKLSPGNLFIIGGRPSAGKTALSLQMACEMARRGLRVCYFSLETGPDTLAARIIANRLSTPLADVKEKRVPQSELDGLADLHKLPLLIRSASSKSVGWIKAQAQRMKAQVVFIDYLQLLEDGQRPLSAGNGYLYRPARAGTDYRNISGSAGSAEPWCCPQHPLCRRSEGIWPVGTGRGRYPASFGRRRAISSRPSEKQGRPCGRDRHHL